MLKHFPSGNSAYTLCRIELKNLNEKYALQLLIYTFCNSLKITSPRNILVQFFLCSSRNFKQQSGLLKFNSFSS